MVATTNPTTYGPLRLLGARLSGQFLLRKSVLRETYPRRKVACTFWFFLQEPGYSPSTRLVSMLRNMQAVTWKRYLIIPQWILSAAVICLCSLGFFAEAKYDKGVLFTNDLIHLSDRNSWTMHKRTM